MATTPRTSIQTGNVRSFIASWANTLAGDQGAPLPFNQYTDRTVQVFGTFGVGGACAIEGSNDGVNWATLNDVQGNPLVFSAPRIELVQEAPAFVRPSVTGDGSTSLTVLIIVKE